MSAWVPVALTAAGLTVAWLSSLALLSWRAGAVVAAINARMDAQDTALAVHQSEDGQRFTRQEHDLQQVLVDLREVARGMAVHSESLARIAEPLGRFARLEAETADVIKATAAHTAEIQAIRSDLVRNESEVQRLRDFRHELETYLPAEYTARGDAARIRAEGAKRRAAKTEEA